jgi:hypothetical protein
MSVEQLEQQLEALSSAERQRFAEWFDDHRHDLIPSSETEAAQQAEMFRRRQEYFDHPERFEQVGTDAELNDYLGGIAREVRARVSPTRPG